VTGDLLTWLAGGLIAFAVAAITTPAGLSGAVLLLPVQVGLLGVPSPAATPTNLIYNVVATPGPLAAHGRRRRLGGPLARALMLGSVPGVMAGAALRATILTGPRAVAGIIALVLLPLGVVLLAGRRPPRARRARPALSRPRTLAAFAAAVGVVGGLYGIGGGAVIAPALAAAGHRMARVVPAALMVTLATAVAGIAAFEAIALLKPGPDTIGPDWILGAAMGAGGLLGGALGVRLTRRLPERLLRRVLGLLVLGVGLRYLVQLVAG
jgi:uncharacterized membrane protein YfcA